MVDITPAEQLQRARGERLWQRAVQRERLTQAEYSAMVSHVIDCGYYRIRDTGNAQAINAMCRIQQAMLAASGVQHG